VRSRSDEIEVKDAFGKRSFEKETAQGECEKRRTCLTACSEKGKRKLSLETAEEGGERSHPGKVKERGTGSKEKRLNSEKKRRRG